MHEKKNVKKNYISTDNNYFITLLFKIEIRSLSVLQE